MQFHQLNNPKDIALAEDARFLASALMHLLEQETSPPVREVLKQLSESSDSTHIIAEALPKLNRKQTQNLIIACSLFAQILNIAEDTHHERRRRAHEEEGISIHSGSLHDTINKLKIENISQTFLQDQLNQTTVAAVMTAHPTEVQRQATLNFHRRIRALLPRREYCINQEELDEL